MEAKEPKEKKQEGGGKGGKKKGANEEEDMSEEDIALKEAMLLMVTRVADPELAIRKAALDSMVKEIREATASMTSVPKPLKFLRPHYATLQAAYEKAAESDKTKPMLADVLSLLAMTMSEEKRASLKYRLLGMQEDVGSWGHEYVRHLAGEFAEEYNERLAAVDSAEMSDATAPSSDDLLPTILKSLVPFFITHNAEAEAIDLLMEIGRIDELVQYVDKTNCDRISTYLAQVASYVPEPEDSQVLSVAVAGLRKLGKYPEALLMAVRLNKDQLIEEILTACDDPLVQKQMAYMLARCGRRPEAEDELARIMDGSWVTEHYLELARDLDVVEPKAPEDVYKMHLEKRATAAANIDSARQNLASTFVNALMNVGFGTDKLMLTEGNKWLYKNKEHGMMSAAASLGAILLWDVDGGLTQIDKFLYSNDNNIKAGALLAVGLLSCGTRNECDPALALLSEYIEAKHPANIKMGAIFGLGLAYAGQKKDEILEMLMPVVADNDTPLEIVAVASLSLGLVFLGSCNEDVSQALMSALMERSQESLEKETLTRLICCGLGLLYLAQQQSVEVALELAKVLEGPVGKYTTLTLETCAYAGSGNVLKVQRLLGLAGEHAPPADEDDAPSAGGGAPAASGGPAGSPSDAKDSAKDCKLDSQTVAVLGVALVAMGEPLGSEMATRILFHLVQYGDPVVRRAVPLALAMLSISNPGQGSIVDTLSKLSHDLDIETATNAIVAMGLVAAGTNNSRVATNLRALATYYAKEPGVLFAVRLSQGLVHAGKGLVTLSAYHPDRSVPHPLAMGGMVVMMHLCLDFKSIVLGKHHFLLYVLACCIRPRMLVTLDEELKPLPVTVRVGTAVDVVGLAGRPKKITGFQTHTTPVLLASGERAELATDEYIPLTSILEGVVVLRKNPDSIEALNKPDAKASPTKEKKPTPG